MKCARVAPRSVLVAAAMALAVAAFAQPRDGGYREDAKDRELTAGECLTDPQCAALLKAQKAKEVRAQAAYDSKPLEDKLAPYIILLAVGVAVYWWVE